jgi:alpha-tubulin suppressor-like RCC1 family protein
VSGLNGIAAVSAAQGYSAALTADGTMVWTWGSNGSGQLGDGTVSSRSTPVKVSRLHETSVIKGGGDHTLALTPEGTVWTWGVNSYGQLGDGATVSRAAPQPVMSLSGVSAIEVGGYHSLALTSDGTVWAWGNNGNGQLGDGTTIRRLAAATPLASSVTVRARTARLPSGWSAWSATRSEARPRADPG